MKNNLVFLVTTNKERHKFVSRALLDYKINVERVEFTEPEIQADNAKEIGVAKALNAAKTLNKNCVCEDTEFLILALNGFPGPYFKYVQSRLSANFLLTALKSIKDRRAVFRSVLVYAQPDGFYQTFETKLEGNIAKQKRGNNGRGWDIIFELKESKKTLAEHNDDEKFNLWSPGYKYLGAWLEKEKGI